MLKIELITASTRKAIELDDIKQHLRLPEGYADEDEYVKTLRDVAIEYAENVTNRKLTRQTYKYYIDNWPTGDRYDSIYLPYPPLVSIPTTGVVYTDSDSNSTTLSSTKYNADTISVPGRLVLDYDDEWPTDTLHNENPISIEFTCGHTSTNLPASIKMGVLHMVATLYENRESVVVGQSVSGVPFGVDMLLMQERVFSF